MIEKLYAYGRYLFLCSTGPTETLPCHLTGLFNGTYQCFWAFHMYNINFEMIYWQALTGNMPEFLKLALEYTEAMVPQFRENSRKIFGCGGILINSVNAPDSGIYKCMENHILNWTGGAAWVSQHFWDYYQFTEDLDYLKEHSLPFMYEAALFYEDFVVEKEDGYYDIYPGVSPENMASNIKKWVSDHTEVETCKNPTMELALLKELLTNLITGCELTGLYSNKLDKWKEMLSKIRPYSVNKDGAIKEWTDDFYEDQYCHRHHSHLYPVFPGCEISKENDLYDAFKKAEDLRLEFGLSDQSSWSMVLTAGIAGRMERGDLALKVIDTISRTCLMNNFFTVHNDWRRMGPIACGDFRTAPFQIDGNIGIPAVINEMLIQSQQGDIFLLPALPTKWKQGHMKGLLVRGKILCDIFWEEGSGYAILRCENSKSKWIRIGSGYTFEDHRKKKKIEIGKETIIQFIRKE